MVDINIDLMFLGKGRRLKQAKEEAQSEIEAYRSKRESEYKKYEQTVSTVLSAMLISLIVRFCKDHYLSKTGPILALRSNS